MIVLFSERDLREDGIVLMLMRVRLLKLRQQNHGALLK